MNKKQKLEAARLAAAAAVEITTTVETAPVAEAPKPLAEVFGRTDVAPNENYIRKGFETVLFAEINNGPGTIAGVTSRLLTSGEYQRVAPRAAELRAAKPVTFLLNKWVRKGLLQLAGAEDAAAVIALEAEQPLLTAGIAPAAVAETPAPEVGTDAGENIETTEVVEQPESTEQPVEAAV